MNSLWNRRLLCQALAIGTATTALSNAPLATAQGALEEIIVTAQRREESLQDIPMSVSAFSSDALEVRVIEDMADLQFAVPNLLADGLRLAIRGIGNNGNSILDRGHYTAH